MAGSITISSITLDSDNNFSIKSNTGSTILSANGAGLLSSQLTTPTITGNLNFDTTGTTGFNTATANTVRVHTAGVEAFRIDSSQNLNVGTTSQIGAEKLGISFNDATLNGLGLQVQGSSSGAGYVAFRNSSGSLIGSISRNGTASSLKFNTTSSGTTGSYLLDSGIAFPATQVASSDANTLDDYEEGTWTPTYYGDGTAGTTTYTGQKGSYTKIGNRVFIELDVSWSGQTGTGSGLIGGLPYAGASYSNDSRGFVYAGAYNGSWAFTGSQVALINNSSSTFLLLYVINNGVLSASSKVTSGEFRIQMNYMTN